MNLDFASVWETIADIVPENDALISVSYTHLRAHET